MSLARYSFSLMRTFQARISSVCASSYTTKPVNDSPKKDAQSSNLPKLTEKTQKLQKFAVLGVQPGTEDLLDTVVDNTPYYELPILYLHACKNNTKLYLTDFNARSLAHATCGGEGFKNARKQSSVAAQTTGMSLGFKAKKLGVKSVRVVTKGLGRRLIDSLQGLVLSGINVVSITDDTPLHYGLGRRPRKPPRK